MRKTAKANGPMEERTDRIGLLPPPSHFSANVFSMLGYELAIQRRVSEAVYKLTEAISAGWGTESPALTIAGLL